jgi:hypothetical protein
MEFVIARARRLRFVNPDTLGVLGFDLGGMAGLLLRPTGYRPDSWLSIESSKATASSSAHSPEDPIFHAD